MQHANGQTIKMLNDKTMTLIGQSGANRLFDASGNIIDTTDQTHKLVCPDVQLGKPISTLSPVVTLAGPSTQVKAWI